MKKLSVYLFFQMILFAGISQNLQTTKLELRSEKLSIDSLMKLQIAEIPEKFIEEVDKKAKEINTEIDKKSAQLVSGFKKYELEILKTLSKTDSLKVNNYLQKAENQYKEFTTLIHNPTNLIQNTFVGEYLPYLDSLKGSFAFLNKLTDLKDIHSEKIKSGLHQISKVQMSFSKADDIKQLIKSRQEQLKNLVSKYTSVPKDVAKKMTQINQKVFNYTTQIKALKESFRNPEDIELKALGLLNRIPAFQKFVKENSMLANLFPAGGGVAATGDLVGLQSRDELLTSVQDKLGLKTGDVSSLVQNKTQSAQGQLDQLRDKLKSLGNVSGDLEMPDFKPDIKKSKSIWDRFEIGADFQNTRSNYFFPQTADLGLSLGYSLNENSIIGIGASYKVGLGKDIKNITITSEGLSLRSFIDWRIKKTFFLTGGLEYNYQQAFSSIGSVIKTNDWQKSGLLGLTKTFSMGGKGMKKTKVQLLWDFLSYQQVPRPQPLKFRIGYIF